MVYLLDTNAWINYLKNHAGPISTRLSSLVPSDIVSCSIVRAELMHGAQRYGNAARRVEVVEKTLLPYSSLGFDDAAANAYGALRHLLEVQGSVIGPLDLQIAAICLVHGATLVTSNLKEFQRVPGLLCVDWRNP